MKILGTSGTSGMNRPIERITDLLRNGQSMAYAWALDGKSVNQSNERTHTHVTQSIAYTSTN
eukprot:7888512-Lingulodinium_polyedra.AAC.1